MERTPKLQQLDIPPIIRHIFRPERSAERKSRTPNCEQRGVLAELERYPELRH